MNTYEALDQLMQILGTDRKLLQEALLHAGADRRRKRSVILLAVLVAWTVLLMTAQTHVLAILSAVAGSLALYLCWRPWFKARKLSAAQNLYNYLQTAPAEMRSAPLAETIQLLLQTGPDTYGGQLRRKDTVNQVVSIAAAAVLGVNLASGVMGVQMQSSREIPPAYTVAPTATPAPAYLVENGEVTLCNWPGDVADGTLTLPAEVDGLPVTAIGKLAFADRDDFTRVVIPEGVRLVDSGAFRSCSNLQEVVLPDSLTELGAEAFKFCMRLPSCTIPAGVRELRAETFAFCAALKEVSLSEGLVKINANAFDNCYALSSIALPETLNAISAYAFRNCSSLVSVEIPDMVNTIGAYAFSNCTALENVRLPATMITGKISERTFEGCASLVSIRIPDGVIKISERAFYNCAKLENVELPSMLREIGSSAFRSCPSLRHIEIPAGCTVDERAFKDSPTVITRK